MRNMAVKYDWVAELYQTVLLIIDLLLNDLRAAGKGLTSSNSTVMISRADIFLYKTNFVI